MSRSRTRRVAKWTGVVVCVATAWLILASHYVAVTVGYGPNAVLLEGGGTRMMRLPFVGDASPGWHWKIEPYEGPGRWWFLFTPRGLPGTAVVIPLWAPLLAIGIPTALLWRRDRRHPPGHCQRCGYDFTGLPEPRCPGCATLRGRLIPTLCSLRCSPLPPRCAHSVYRGKRWFCPPPAPEIGSHSIIGVS